MTPRAKSIANLVERLAAASGADRELDCTIAATLGIVADFDATIFKEPITYRVSDDGRRVEAWTQTNKIAQAWRQASRAPLPYTSSIDAAMTLVPPDCQWTLEQDTAWVRWMGKENVEEVQGYFLQQEGKMTAIALTIAALKAIAAREGE